MEYQVVRTDSLEHHGILGMKWGVRRYQNKDGSYTREGMRRYNKSMSDYESARSKYKETKGGTKEERKSARNEMRVAKRKLNKNYDQLKRDLAADKGKALYAKGKTITGDQLRYQTAGAVAAGTAFVSKFLADSGNIKLAAATGIIGTGISVANAIFGIKATSDEIT